MSNETWNVPRAALVVLGSSLLLGCTPGPAGTDSGATDLAVAADLAMPAGPDMASRCGNALVLGPQLPDIAPECEACAERACCQEIAACSGSADCVALRQCFSKCPAPDDQGCVTRCNSQYNAARTASGNLSACRNSNCTTECANFACLGKVVWPDRSATRAIPIQLVDFVTGSPMGGVTVKVCPLADAACANPRETVTTMMDGTTTVHLTEQKGGIDSYLEQSGPNVATVLSIVMDRDPELLFAIQPLSVNGVTTSSLGQIESASGYKFDPKRGLLGFRGVQCTRYPAPGLKGATDKADGMSGIFYLAGGLPSKTADRTDASGTGFLFNIPPGDTTLTTTLAATGATHGKYTVHVRAGALTLVTAVPTP